MAAGRALHGQVGTALPQGRAARTTLRQRGIFTIRNAGITNSNARFPFATLRTIAAL